MSWFWPIVTGQSFFDVWTLPHLGFWVVVASVLKPLKLPKWPSFLVCMGLAVSWEVFEIFAFELWPDVWNDPESWWNSILSDPLTCAVGFLGFWYLHDKGVRRG